MTGELRIFPQNFVGKPALVDHIALSDGIATVSIFVEPVFDKSSPPIPGFYSGHGAINVYIRTIGDRKITTVGEVPLETVREIGDAVFKRENKAE